MSIKTLSALLVSAVLSSQAQASPHPGKQLLDRHCVSCHGSEVYTRAERRVTSLPGLQTQVRRCELSLGLKWFDDEIADVADYLNQTFYKFE